MAPPTQPVTLSIEQIDAWQHKLADLRHDVNNNLSLITAAAELIRRRPETAERFLDSLIEQPKKISETISRFSSDFEAALHLTKP
jgi:hypothetical protein